VHEAREYRVQAVPIFYFSLNTMMNAHALKGDAAVGLEPDVTTLSTLMIAHALMLQHANG